MSLLGAAVWIVLKEIGDVTAGADLGEKKSWCLREVVSFCARGTWSQRDDAPGIAIVSQGLRESTHSRRESYVMQIPPRTPRDPEAVRGIQMPA